MSVALTLYAIEDDLQALTESLETCPPELEAELQARIADYMALEASKVDQVAHFLASLKYGKRARKDEIARLNEECKSIDAATERLEGYVCRIIQAKGGGKLAGKTNTFSVRPSDAVVITDADAVPEGFKKVTVTMPYTQWFRILGGAIFREYTVAADKAAIKKALKAGETVPGADLEYRSNLQRK